MSFRPYRDLMSRDFFVLEPAWTVKQTLDLLDQLDPEYVLLPLPENDRAFYVGTGEEIKIRLDRASDEARVRDLPDLLAEGPVPIRDAWEDADDPPDVCLVVEDDEIVGIYDVYRGDRTLRGAEDALVDRYLTAEYPPSVPKGQVASVLVSLEVELLGIEEAPLIQLSEGSRVDLVLLSRHGFEIEGPRDGHLIVEPEDVEPSPFQFRVRATETGLGHLEVLAFHQGSFLGRVVISPRVEEASTRHPVEQRQRYNKLQAPALQVPDLTLVILEEKRSNGHSISYLLFSADQRVRHRLLYGPSEVTPELEQEIQEILVQCEDSENLASSRAIRTRLQNRGHHLFQKLLPADLQELLAGLGEDVQSIQIYSQEHTIPWEVFHLPMSAGGDEKFFATRFALSRWRLDQFRCSELRLDRMGLVAPITKNLAGDEEARELEGLSTSPVQVQRLSAEYEELLETLGQGRYQALHFISHGHASTEAGDQAKVDLEDFVELRPSDLSLLGKPFQKAKPLVFLNACHTGLGGRGLDVNGGWAKRFLEAGAAAFVGTLWGVRDGSARVFSKTFYKELLDGKPIGEAARQARLETRKAFEDKASWLAYTVYADPLAKVVSK